MSHLANALDPILEQQIGTREKAFPPHLASVPLREIADQGLSVRRGDLMLPALVLRQEPLEHNIELMADWCRRHAVALAPHGKTTMAPQLFHRQLDAGAWAISAATVSQAAVMHEFGVRRVLIANEVVDPAGMRWIAETLAADPGFELLCLVDSTTAVAALDEALAGAGSERALPVLIELGATGRRAGARTDDEADAVAAAVADSRRLRLAGVECFEGVIGPGREPQAMAEVDALLARVRGLAQRLDAAGAFAAADEILLTAGGSVFFDRVAQLRDVGNLSRPVRVVLRSGCYVTHDARAYEELSPLGGVLGDPHEPHLQPALELWSAVLSRPEPELAILGFGRRDAPYDSYLPTPLHIVAPGGESRPIGAEVEVFALNDQHAFLRVPPDLPLAVGTRVVCGISHPCTAFDKWPLVPVVDAHDDLVGAVRTFF
ncbi:MAG: hypothetical protein V7607_5698 [Solirubrobacteraceae bacterium]